MSWNIAPEAVSAVVLCILWIYSRKGNLIPNMKNRLFEVSFLTTFCAMASNIFSTVLIYSLNEHTLILTWLVNLIYFITTPLMGMAYFLYVLANIYEGHPKIGRYLLTASMPGLAYSVLILLNPINKAVFNITLERGYEQGPLILFTYLIFYLYCVACVILVLWKGKRVAPEIRHILFAFPVIAAAVIVIQYLNPHIILSGSAATCAMLLIYLYLQNKQSCIDYLTGIPNRHEFLKMLEVYTRKKYTFTILVVSLREFKLVNDTYGQHNGDALLACVSGFLKKDLSLHEGEIYRYSGDEFALLLKNATKPSVQALTLKLLHRMQTPWTAGSCTCMLSAAIGLVSCPNSSDEMEGLVNGLEYAVFMAKKDKANCNLCYCTPELLEKSKRRQVIAGLLERNLQSGGFEIHYQPIYSVPERRFVKAEALLRMSDPVLGSISPVEFIPIAEECGLIVDITYLVFEKVCGYIRHLLDEGVFLEGISVNFCALQFNQKDLLSRMVESIERNRIPANLVKIELTESILAQNMQVVAQYIQAMHKLGIHIGLDDFGTGYSNLVSVIDLPIDTVKLDKSLVWSAMKNTRFAIAVENFARAFRELGMRVLAEGVETEEQSDFVIGCGCELIQGFLYARPLPQQEFEAFLKAHTEATHRQ